MRRAFAIIIALALISSASVAFADSIGAEEIVTQNGICDFPDLQMFSVLRASVPDEFGRVTVTLSEPVDKLWANWMGKGEKPEELLVDETLTAKFYTKGHPYQVGSMPPAQARLFKQETSKRYVIQFGALQSQINWRTVQARNAAGHGDWVEVVEPNWILYRISDDVVFNEYSDKLNCTDIHVPEGYKLVKKTGYAVAYSPKGVGSDGSPNLAYITEQNGFTVIYNRAGKIVSIIKQIPQSHIFSSRTGTATVRYQLSEFGKWYVSDITEVYPNNRSLTAVYSRYGNGKLVDCQVSDF